MFDRDRVYDLRAACSDCFVASAPMDYGTRKAASSATGFIDGVGYIGAAVTGILSGWLTDAWSWDAAFYLWILGAIVAGVLMLLL